MKKNTIHPPFDLYTLFLIAMMRWVESVAKMTEKITCRKTVTSGSRKDRIETHHERALFEDERWMEISQRECVMVRSDIEILDLRTLQSHLTDYLDSEEFTTSFSVK